MGYQTGFIILQIFFTLIVGWFVKLLMKFSKDIEALDERVDKVESKHLVCETIRGEKEKNIMNSLERIEEMIRSITTLNVKESK